MFQGSYEEIKKLSQLDEQPIKGLFTADDNRQSYYLSYNNNSYIYIIMMNYMIMRPIYIFLVLILELNM